MSAIDISSLELTIYPRLKGKLVLMYALLREPFDAIRGLRYLSVLPIDSIPLEATSPPVPLFQHSSDPLLFVGLRDLAPVPPLVLEELLPFISLLVEPISYVTIANFLHPIIDYFSC